MGESSEHLLVLGKDTIGEFLKIGSKAGIGILLDTTIQSRSYHGNFFLRQDGNLLQKLGQVHEQSIYSLPPSFKPDSQMTPHPITRRRFIGEASCAAVSSIPVLSSLLNLSVTGKLAASESSGGYRALVCVFLSGGNDSFNMLAPYDAAHYAEYAASGAACAQRRRLGRPDG